MLRNFDEIERLVVWHLQYTNANKCRIRYLRITQVQKKKKKKKNLTTEVPTTTTM